MHAQRNLRLAAIASEMTFTDEKAGKYSPFKI
jgi:hypothetical protein